VRQRGALVQMCHRLWGGLSISSDGNHVLRIEDTLAHPFLTFGFANVLLYGVLSLSCAALFSPRCWLPAFLSGTLGRFFGGELSTDSPLRTSSRLHSGLECGLP
jgi:hypothetical protein